MGILDISDLVVMRNGDLPVLDGLSLSLSEGELLAVLGRNGAGKTTLVETIAGLLKPESGTIRLAGDRIDDCPPHEVARRGIALVPEGRRLFPNMTIMENLAVGAHATPWWWGGPPSSALDIVWRLFPDLWDMRKRPVRDLSGGQRQMVAIGRALASSPRLLVLDEPSFGLSPQLVAVTCEHLATLREEGVSILLVEQNVDVALQVCTRAVLLSERQIVARGPLDELVVQPVFGAAMFGVGAGTDGDEGSLTEGPTDRAPRTLP